MNTENNKIIAEFMGVKPNRGGEYEMYGVIQSIEDGLKEKHFFFSSEMHFRSDWNWIMEAVEKIENIGATVIIGRMFCDIKYTNPLDQSKHFEIRIACGVKINAINGAVIKFIKWHNKQKS